MIGIRQCIAQISQALYSLIGTGSCQHVNVQMHDLPGFCPDCGYAVKLIWALIQCRQCQAKRVPQESWNGEIQPVQPFCRHCGHDQFKIIKKERIEAYELVYALSLKTTVYEETPPSVYTPVKNPYRTTVQVEHGDVFEAEILNRREYRMSRRTNSNNAKSPFHDPSEFKRNGLLLLTK